MPHEAGPYFQDHSRTLRAIRQHYVGRGVTSERKLDRLVHRWIRRRGYRCPM